MVDTPPWAPESCTDCACEAPHPASITPVSNVRTLRQRSIFIVKAIPPGSRGYRGACRQHATIPRAFALRPTTYRQVQRPHCRIWHTQAACRTQDCSTAEKRPLNLLGVHSRAPCRQIAELFSSNEHTKALESASPRHERLNPTGCWPPLWPVSAAARTVSLAADRRHDSTWAFVPPLFAQPRKQGAGRPGQGSRARSAHRQCAEKGRTDVIKPSMLSKLEALTERLEEVGELLADADIMTDFATCRANMRNSARSRPVLAPTGGRSRPHSPRNA